MIIFSDSTSLYFYSALLQGNAALITLVAMFLVYRKQYLDTVFDNLEKRTIDYLCKALKIATNYGDVFSLENYSEKFCSGLDALSKEKYKNVLAQDSWSARFTELRTVDKQRTNLWQTSVVPVRLIFIILGASVIMLPMSDQLHINAYLEFVSFLVYGVSEIVMLVLLYKFIKGQFV